MKSVIDCPYCREKVHFESDRSEFFDYAFDCKECKNTFSIGFEVTQAFKTYRPPQFCVSNGNKHKYKKIDDPQSSNLYECTVCGELRSDTNGRPNKQIRDQVVEG